MWGEIIQEHIDTAREWRKARHPITSATPITKAKSPIEEEAEKTLRAVRAANRQAYRDEFFSHIWRRILIFLVISGVLGIVIGSANTSFQIHRINVFDSALSAAVIFGVFVVAHALEFREKSPALRQARYHLRAAQRLTRALSSLEGSSTVIYGRRIREFKLDAIVVNATAVYVIALAPERGRYSAKSAKLHRRGAKAVPVDAASISALASMLYQSSGNAAWVRPVLVIDAPNLRETPITKEIKDSPRVSIVGLPYVGVFLASQPSIQTEHRVADIVESVMTGTDSISIVGDGVPTEWTT